MTNSNFPINFDIFQYLLSLQSSIEALRCAAFNLAVGVDDDSDSVLYLFQILSNRIDGDLAAVFNALQSFYSQSVSS